MISPAIPNVATADLPTSYANALVALSECARIDECKEWADKAAAIASYARQADDPALHDFATRIRGRAVRRCGELLAEFKTPNDGSRNGARQPPSPTVDSKRTVAASAGLSERQELQAARIAAIPAAEFEALVESETPPTVSQLAALGTKSQQRTATSRGFTEATQAMGALAEFDEQVVRRYDPRFLAAGVFGYEVPDVRAHVASVQTWLASLDEVLSDEPSDEP